MAILKEFKEFAVKGNVIDLAVGMMIGSEFSKIVSSLVADIILPPIGLLIGDINFKNFFIVLKDGANPGPYSSVELAKSAGALTMNIGNFITSSLTFVIMAWVLFLMIKGVNKIRSIDR